MNYELGRILKEVVVVEMEIYAGMYLERLS
jgi:hypothetical protein